MIPDRELRNFQIFLRANPHLMNSGSEGAFDAKPSGKKNIRFNKEKRFTVALSDFSRGGAFDAAAVETESKPGNGLSLDGLKGLAMKLSPDAWTALYDVLNGNGAADPTGEDEELDEKSKSDAPAMDSAAAKSFAERYPDIAGVRVNTIGQQPRSEPSRLTAKGAASFNAMFPEAARIKVR